MQASFTTRASIPSKPWPAFEPGVLVVRRVSEIRLPGPVHPLQPDLCGDRPLVGRRARGGALTLASQAALLACAWVLARTVMPVPMAVLGLGLLIAVPGDYGSGRIFTCMESFLTPRMAAEALSLAGLAAALQHSKRTATLLMAGAALLHPHHGHGRHRRALLAVRGRTPARHGGVAAAAVAAWALASWAVPPGPLGRFDAEWLTWVEHRSPYLFLESWTIDDGARAAVTLVTLLVGLLVLPPPGRLLAKITLITCTSGLALTFGGCDLLHLVPVTQLQPWRWLWLGTVVSALLLPRRRPHALGDEPPGAGDLAAAALRLDFCRHSLRAGRRGNGAGAARGGAAPAGGRSPLGVPGFLGMLGHCRRLAAGVEPRVHRFALSRPQHSRMAAPGHELRSRRQRARGPVCGAWWLARRPAKRLGLAALAGARGGGLCRPDSVHLVPAGPSANYPPQLVAQFAGFRDLIPPGAEVAWLESPVGAWILLDRPSYLSVLQTSGLVFSLQGGPGIEAPIAALGPAIDPATFMDWEGAGTGMTLSRQQLRAACGSGEFAFLVSAADLGFGAGGGRAFERSTPGANPFVPLHRAGCSMRRKVLLDTVCPAASYVISSIQEAKKTRRTHVQWKDGIGHGRIGLLRETFRPDGAGPVQAGAPDRRIRATS